MHETRSKSGLTGLWFVVLAFLLVSTVGCASWFSDDLDGTPPPPPPPPVGDDPVITGGLTPPATQPGLGDAVTLGVTATDPQDQTLTYTWDDGNADSGEFSGTGANVTWASAVEGTYTITCTVTDTDGNTTVTTTEITVGDVDPPPPPPPGNEDPVFVDGEGNAVTSLEGDVHDPVSTQTVKFSAMATDANDDPITYSWSADGGVFTEEAVEDGTASVLWAADAAGTFVVTVTADDGQGGASSVSAAVGLSTDAITVTAIPTEFVFAGYETCNNCHSDMVTGWQTTGHATKEDKMQVQGTGRIDYCRGCHNVGYEQGGYISYETTPQFANIQCEVCHGAYSGAGSGHMEINWDPGKGYETDVDGNYVIDDGSYVLDATYDGTEGYGCGKCHMGSRHGAFEEWANSDHANAPMVDEEGHPEHNVTGSSCVQCHNGAYFVDIQVRGNDPPESSIPDEEFDASSARISCATCHDPHSNQFGSQLRVDPTATVTIPFDDTVVGPAGNGMICMKCHNGRRDRSDYDRMVVGASSRGVHGNAESPFFWGIMGADLGAVVDYDNDHAHNQMTQDACVTCHMYRKDYEDSDNPAIWGHSLEPKVEACQACHTSATTLDDIYGDLHTEIAGLLQDFVDAWPAQWKDVTDPADPDLETRDTDPATGVGPPRDHAIGNSYREALWNYKLVTADGSMGVHNPTFARSLLNEAIARLGELTPPPQEYFEADGINGGMLYDKFWATEGGWDQGDPNIATYDASANFFRCKQCHGWDLLGNEGFYVSRAPSATRPNVTGLDLHTLAAGMTEQELFDSLKDPTGRRGIAVDLSTYDPDTNSTDGDMMPDYGALMTDAQIWDIVRFLKETAIDTSTLYDSELTGTYPTGSLAFSNIGLDGDAVAGATVYSDNCSACHGADGTTIPLGSRSVGVFIREKANEAQHKIKYGQLGTAMGSLVTDDGDMLDMYKALADDVAFPAL